MILYHGSNTNIQYIDLNLCRHYKDFGKGFYLTDIKETQLYRESSAYLYEIFQAT